MYLFVLYDYDMNIILVRLMKVITYNKCIQVLKDLNGKLLTRGLKPAYMQLDNEAPPEFQR